MPIKKIIYFYAVFCLLASCKTFKTVTSSPHHSTTQPSNNSQTVAHKKINFLNDIEVTPGNTVKPLHVIKKEKKQQDLDLPVQISHVNTSFKEEDLETINKLQFKYAILLDVSVENLTNTVLLQEIDNWWGTHYCYGGSTKNCIDCSALTQMFMQDIYQIKIPRTAQEQFNACEKIEENDLREGDLVFFHGTAGRRSPYISHVGIYVANNKFVHASSSGSGVTISDLNDEYFKKHFAGSGRMLNRQQLQANSK